MNARLLSRVLRVAPPPPETLRLLRCGDGHQVSTANAILLNPDSPTTPVGRHQRYQWALVLARGNVRSADFVRRQRSGELQKQLLKDGRPDLVANELLTRIARVGGC
jgi:hypothetical protein